MIDSALLFFWVGETMKGLKCFWLKGREKLRGITDGGLPVTGIFQDEIAYYEATLGGHISQENLL